jgi:hypothetical protein
MGGGLRRSILTNRGQDHKPRHAAAQLQQCLAPIVGVGLQEQKSACPINAEGDHNTCREFIPFAADCC